MFEDFIRDGSVRRVSPDRQLAKSLMKIAGLRIWSVLNLLAYS